MRSRAAATRRLAGRVPQPAWLPAALLLVLAGGFFAARASHGIHFLSFGDESGHFVGARAIHAGDRLYRDFIDAHGPLSFMVAHLFGVLFGWREPLDARWAVCTIVVASACLIGASPALRGFAARLWAVALFLGLIAAPWLVQALNMVNYHVLGGALVAIVLAQLVIPAWIGAEGGAWGAVLSGVCLAMLCAAAYTLAPSAILLVASAIFFTRANSRPTADVVKRLSAGFACGSLAVLVWLLIFGDVGGYLVFHVISNQLNYGRYAAHGLGRIWFSITPSLAPDARVQLLATLLSGTACLLMAHQIYRSGRRSSADAWTGLLAAIAGLLMLNLRGAKGFQNGSFVVASIALFALVLPVCLALWKQQASASAAWAWTLALGLLICGSEMIQRGAVASPFNAPRANYLRWPKTRLAVDAKRPETRLLRRILQPDERLLVLVYKPDFFLPTGFLPLRKFHEYLPWEADYARSPVFGRERDLCAEVGRQHPPVIVYDAWKVWGTYDPAVFMPCIPPLLASDYTKSDLPFIYIRKDRVPAHG